MRVIKIPQHEFALKMEGGGGGAHFRDTTVISGQTIWVAFPVSPYSVKTKNATAVISLHTNEYNNSTKRAFFCVEVCNLYMIAQLYTTSS